MLVLEIQVLVFLLFIDHVFAWKDDLSQKLTNGFWSYSYERISGSLQMPILEYFRVEQITGPLGTGEGPHWDTQQRVLWFVDIRGHTIHRYDPATKSHTKTHLDNEVSFIIPVEGTYDEFVVGTGQQFQVIRWDGRDGNPAELVRVLAKVDQGRPTVTNDAKCDPAERLFAGTIGIEISPMVYEKNKSSLYRLDGTKIRRIVEHVTVSNGMAWDLRQKAFYYTDSEEKKIRRYDYDIYTGDISQNHTFAFDFVKHDLKIAPDGFTIDTDGNLWIADYGGYGIINVDPRTGEFLRKVPIPSKLITSATFGGPDLSTLFVTSAHSPDPEYIATSGGTFMVTGLGVRGYPNVNLKLY